MNELVEGFELNPRSHYALWLKRMEERTAPPRPLQIPTELEYLADNLARNRDPRSISRWALAAFLLDHNSGEGSRGERILWRMRAGRHFVETHLCETLLSELRETETYRTLVTKYGGKI